MDSDIEALKVEVKELRAIAVDTNRIIHGMRSSQRRHAFISVLWWLLVIGTTVASYLYIQPYLQKAQDAYTGFQQQSQKVEGWQQQAQDVLNKYLGQPKAQ